MTSATRQCIQGVDLLTSQLPFESCIRRQGDALNSEVLERKFDAVIDK
jgi:hypothetical protein